MNLLDTDILIDIQRGNNAALSWFRGLQDLPAVPGFVVMELIQSSQNKQQVQNSMKLVGPLTIVWPTADDCKQALDNFQIYHLSHSLGLTDALIASCAVGLSATLYTFNIKHYKPIPNLKILQPYDRS